MANGREKLFETELAARFAKGKLVTLHDSMNQPIRIASLSLHKQACKVYNLEVEGQGKSGHTYYAAGILVHNGRAGNISK